MNNRTIAEVFPPGEFLRDELEARGWTQTEFAEIIQRPPRVVNEVISGRRGISPETAKELSEALGTSAEFWLNLETAYQLSKTRQPSEEIGRNARLRENFPVREMIKIGWIEESPNVSVIETRVLEHFGVASTEVEPSIPHAARRRSGEDISPRQYAWLFRVRNLAASFHTTKFSVAKLRSALSDLEGLMNDVDEIRHVPRILSDCGVKFIIVEPIPGSKIDGGCLWLDNGKTPVIGMTLRYDRIDNFWFVLRHEIEHVIRGDGKKIWLIDDTDDLSEENNAERLANEAASDFCVDQKVLANFITRVSPYFSDAKVRGFAKISARHPGIVVGQLRRKTGRNNIFAKYLVKVRQAIVPFAVTDGYGETITTIGSE